MREEGDKSDKGDKGDKRDKRDKSDKGNKHYKWDKGYHKLIVWQKAHRFAIFVYEKTRYFPRNELYGLTSQLRRAALSVPANIVERYAKSSKKGIFEIFRNCKRFSG